MFSGFADFEAYQRWEKGLTRMAEQQQDAEFTRKPVTCEKCGRIWWVTYGDALTAMQAGKMRTKSRQKREGEGFGPGQWVEERYLAGICEACDFGLVKPAPEIEWLMIIRLRDKFLRRGVDPELAFDYARAEYETDYHATFNPAFAEWWAAAGWRSADNPFAGVDLDRLPPSYLGKEAGMGDGSPKCPHVRNQYGPFPWVKA